MIVPANRSLPIPFVVFQIFIFYKPHDLSMLRGLGDGKVSLNKQSLSIHRQNELFTMTLPLTLVGICVGKVVNNNGA